MISPEADGVQGGRRTLPVRLTLPGGARGYDDTYTRAPKRFDDRRDHPRALRFNTRENSARAYRRGRLSGLLYRLLRVHAAARE
jgi:hypothetical protein